MKGQQISELLNHIDDDLLADAMPPAWRAGRVKNPKKERHPFRTLGRIMDSGWTAAALSVVVSVAVLVAIVMAGRAGGTNPGISPGVTPGENPADSLAGDGNHELDNSTGDQSSILLGTNADGRDPAPETSPVEWTVAPVVMHLDGFLLVDNMVGLHDGYVIYESVTDYTNGTGYDADGTGALYILPELADGLIANRRFLTTGCESIRFTTNDDALSVTKITVCDPLCEGVYYSVSGSVLDADVLREGGYEGYFLVVEVKEHRSSAGYEKEGVSEYPVYLSLKSDTSAATPPADETFAPVPVEGYPPETMTFTASAVWDALYGRLSSHPESMDMKMFAKQYCPIFSSYEASAMVRLIRSVPVPGYKDTPASHVSYVAGDRGITFTVEEAGLKYQFEMILDASEANQLLFGQLNTLDDPIVLSDDLRVLATTDVSSSDSWLLWMDVGGVFAKVSVWNNGTSLAGLRLVDVFDAIQLHRFDPAMGYVDVSAAYASGDRETLIATAHRVRPEMHFRAAHDGGYALSAVVNYQFNFAESPVRQIDVPVSVNGKRVTEIAGGAFDGVDVIYVFIPVGVTKIAPDAFANCDGLTTLLYEGTKSEWTAKAEGWAPGGNLLPGAYQVICSDGGIEYPGQGT